MRELEQYLREALPIGGPLNGLPYCDENPINTKEYRGVYWYWTDGTGYANISVNHYYPEIGVRGDGSEAVIDVDATGGETCDESTQTNGE